MTTAELRHPIIITGPERAEEPPNRHSLGSSSSRRLYREQRRCTRLSARAANYGKHNFLFGRVIIEVDVLRYEGI